MTIHFISGASRVGKSHLYRRLHAAFEGDCVELDPLLTALIAFIKPKHNDPILNLFTIDGQSFDDWIAGLIAKDERWWALLRSWVEDHHSYGNDFLLVGIVWPHLLAQLTIPHRAVFLVDTGEDHGDRLVEIARKKAELNNWQQQWDEASVRQWSEYNRRRSLFFREQAEKYHYPVFDVADYGYEASQRLATASLLG